MTQDSPAELYNFRPFNRSYTHLVNRMLQSYEDPSRKRCESGWTFSMHHADELLSPNVWKNGFNPGIYTKGDGPVKQRRNYFLNHANNTIHELMLKRIDAAKRCFELSVPVDSEYEKDFQTAIDERWSSVYVLAEREPKQSGK